MVTATYEDDGRIKPWMGAALAAPVLTDAEIDALGVPAGCVPGTRADDREQLRSSPFGQLNGEAGVERWMAQSDTLHRRLVASLAKRNGWTEAQCAAAHSVGGRLPTSAPIVHQKGRNKGKLTGRMQPVHVVPVLEAAAARAGA